MKIVICNSYDEMSMLGAKVIAGQILTKSNSVIGLATGSTPLGLYKNLIKMNKDGLLDFTDVTTFNLDEYYPIDPKDKNSYRRFMDENLFNHINIKKENAHVLNGAAQDYEKECEEYDNNIRAHGGIDVMLLGIGRNGHIGFNEPNESLVSATHRQILTENTRDANSRFFSGIDEVPKAALTMGMGTIIKESKKIILLASGKDKHEAVKGLVSGNITSNDPASYLNLHKDVTLFLDKEAFNG